MKYYYFWFEKTDIRHIGIILPVSIWPTDCGGGPKILKAGHVTSPRSVGGRRWPHIWIHWPRFAYSLYNFHGSTMTIKGSLQISIPIIKAFLTQNCVPPIISFLGGMGSKCIIFVFGTPKRHILERKNVIWRIVKSVHGSWLQSIQLLSAPTDRRTKKLAESLDAHFRIFGAERG